MHFVVVFKFQNMYLTDLKVTVLLIQSYNVLFSNKFTWKSINSQLCFPLYLDLFRVSLFLAKFLQILLVNLLNLLNIELISHLAAFATIDHLSPSYLETLYPNGHDNHPLHIFLPPIGKCGCFSSVSFEAALLPPIF